ncbi:BamA/TamA family outer membrane protein, partial [Salmonella enterica]|uniref:BamA/TamA family outer membrane protein n=1 Tax=Salmonella enterica TaxID=28901 RepID=UPI0032987D01
AYGNGYGKDTALPFFKNFYVGGSKTIRAFGENALGPKDSLGHPFGGNLLLVSRFDIALPNWFSDGPASTRMT